ncbi:MAG: UDP-N-acetylmuramate dehydrogenase [Candidatus Peribacteraceae bacterium]|nr:UDP-N-acetylmuramate dehydrogenase [Candidatus Peribacteraceae bacterium]
MQIQELVPLAPKTTMRIGGNARYFAELKTTRDAEEVWNFAQEKKLPMIALGSGANTVFADGTIEAVVVHIGANAMEVSGNTVRVEAGAILATVVSTLAKRGLDLSALTGIPGTVGGAIFGNAGQGPKGLWLDHYVQTVIVFADGEWKTLSKEECTFAYRESIFKKWAAQDSRLKTQDSPIIWKASLSVPSRSANDIEREITLLLKKRTIAQPFTRTAGSCFKAQPDGTPAWKLIEAAGLKGATVGDLQVSEKHANFLINTGSASFNDVQRAVERIRNAVPQPLQLEMRLVGTDGQVMP